ncbi:WXG100 family type VII secretion target [Streptomyces noursei]|uniref:WXG100 family type VII secretion target n=1 Tax=Streptomyces noursei TaxID=1971 RepID=UPI0038060C52
MSGDESVAEQVYEAGLDIINPGGDPDVLRSAAKGWRDLHENLQNMFQDLDREVQQTLDSGWRGPAAESFAERWKNLDAAMKKSLPQLPEAAKSLDEAADAIEDINREIHEIYLEIGISIGISVGMSFLTMGFSASPVPPAGLPSTARTSTCRPAWARTSRSRVRRRELSTVAAGPSPNRCTTPSGRRNRTSPSRAHRRADPPTHHRGRRRVQ